MNCKPAPLMLTVTFALTLGIVGCGSSSNNDQPQQPAPNTTAQTPPQSPYTAAQPAPGTTAAQPMRAGSSGMAASNGSAGSTGMGPGFETLAGSKGYITQDAQHLPWLQNHFSQCDTNGDGRITRQEYSRCRKGQAQGTMQQPPPTQPPQGGSSSG